MLARPVIGFLVFAGLVLAGCGEANALPTPDIPATVAAEVEKRLSAVPTDTPVPTPAPAPTPAPTPTPTKTSLATEPGLLPTRKPYSVAHP